MSKPIEAMPGDLRSLGKALKDAGDKSLRKELLAGIRKVGKPAIEDVRASALATLPNKGGLNERIAKSRFGVRTRLSGNSAGVQIKQTDKGKAASSIDEAGTWRHPVHGNRRAWVEQTYGPAKGWFTEPLDDQGPRLRREIAGVMSDVAAKIGRSV